MKVGARLIPRDAVGVLICVEAELGVGFIFPLVFGRSPTESEQRERHHTHTHTHR